MAVKLLTICAVLVSGILSDMPKKVNRPSRCIQELASI